ncbi:WTAP/Mum2p family domain-containing protein [Phthorimaea operculella]|nr:WTAP/Mum2p family domain-containing protein [Phthorimaea operculella]
MTSSGRIAKLEGDLALQKSFSEEVKKSQSELDEFLQELDEDVEGMQSTVLFLQQELRAAHTSVNGKESPPPQAAILPGQRVPPARGRQAAPRVRPLPRLQRGRGAAHGHQRRRRLAPTHGVLPDAAIMK